MRYIYAKYVHRRCINKFFPFLKCMLIFSRLESTLGATFWKGMTCRVWGVTRKKSNCLPATFVFVVEKLEENNFVRITMPYHRVRKSKEWKKLESSLNEAPASFRFFNWESLRNEKNSVNCTSSFHFRRASLATLRLSLSSLLTL